MNETPEQQVTALPPVLQTALASLDLKVESELAYYRQQQAQLLIPPEDNISLSPDVQSDEVQSNDDAQAPADVTVSDRPHAGAPQEQAVLDESTVEPETLPDAALVPEPEMQEAAIVTRDAQLADTEGMIEIETPADAALDSETAEPLNTPPPADFPKSYENYLDPSIEDYLESSEALLRHLEESKVEPEQKPQLKKNLLPGLLLALLILSLGAILFWGVRRGQRPANQPQPTNTVSPSPSSSLAPSPSLGLPQLPITPVSPTPSGTPSPTTPSPIPIQPPSPSATASPVPSASPAFP
jgi:hypothetical protein